MDFSNWPSPQPSQSTTSNFFGDFSFNSPLNSTSSTTSLPTTSMYYSNFSLFILELLIFRISPSSNLLSFADDDFEEFSEPTPSKNSTFDFNFSQAASPLNNSKNLDDDDFDFDFTPGKKVQGM